MGRKLVRVAPSADADRNGAVQAGMNSSRIAAEQANRGIQTLPGTVFPTGVLQRLHDTISTPLHRRLNLQESDNCGIPRSGAAEPEAWRDRPGRHAELASWSSLSCRKAARISKASLGKFVSAISRTDVAAEARGGSRRPQTTRGSLKGGYAALREASQLGTSARRAPNPPREIT